MRSSTLRSQQWKNVLRVEQWINPHDHPLVLYATLRSYLLAVWVFIFVSSSAGQGAYIQNKGFGFGLSKNVVWTSKRGLCDFLKLVTRMMPTRMVGEWLVLDPFVPSKPSWLRWRLRLATEGHFTTCPRTTAWGPQTALQQGDGDAWITWAYVYIFFFRFIYIYIFIYLDR